MTQSTARVRSRPGASIFAARSARTPVVSAPAPEDWCRATEAARKLAQQHGLSLHRIKGTGRDGQVTAADVQRALKAG